MWTKRIRPVVLVVILGVIGLGAYLSYLGHAEIGGVGAMTVIAGLGDKVIEKG